MATSDRSLVKSLGRAGEVFFRSFPALRPSQRAAIPPVLAGQNILLACPTASGKTEALFAPLVCSILSRSSSTEGIRLLAIAPTRALVNDLHARLEPTLNELGLDCARQTSDHHAGSRLPFLVITTPESFDSMLARRSRFGTDGRPEGHALDTVEAVFIDEAHLFDNSARGDQLLWLLARLERLKRLRAAAEGSSPAVQVCAASATVSDPQSLASRLLGPESMVVSVPGGRELLIYDANGPQPWSAIGAADTIDAVRERIVLADPPDSVEALAGPIWQAMSGNDDTRVRKVLVFVPSRSMCDELSTAMKQHLRTRRQVAVFAHHGSLDRAVREASERGFGGARDSLLVATSTLEVGVDIGDVDAVVLVGPPADTNGLLQRIGRSGRRLGITRVVAIARSQVDRYALASMLLAARDGICDPIRYGRRWSVCVQQISSFVRQGHATGRRAKDITDLAETVWPGGGASSAHAILTHLEQQGVLERAHQDRMRFGEAWQARWDGMGMHANIDGAAVGTPVVDAVTGETLAHIPAGSRIPDQISMAGANWQVTLGQGEILLKGINTGSVRGAIRYGSRKGPVGRAFARHVALGMGFDENDFVCLAHGAQRYVFHFGGSVFERVLGAVLGGLQSLAGLGGIALTGALAQPLAEACSDPKRVEDLLMACLLESPGLVSPGAYYSQLPEDLQRETLRELMPVEDFIRWIESRRLLDVETRSQEGTRLLELVGR